MLKRFVLCAGLLSGLSAIACSDRAADLVAPFRQNAFAAGDSIFIFSGNAQVGRAGVRLPKGLQVIVRNGTAPVAYAAGRFTVTAGDGSVSRVTFRTNSEGIAQFNWTLGASGPQQVTASLNYGNAVVFTATVIPASSTLTLVRGNNQTGLPGDTLAADLFVELRDPLGTVIPGATVRYTTVTAHGGAAKFASRTTNAAGRALNRWMLGWGASTQTLKAFVPGVDTVVFNATTSTAGITFEVIGGNAQTANAGSTLPDVIVVRLKKNGISVEGVRGTFAVSAGAGSLNRYGFTTNTFGRATASWTLGFDGAAQTGTASIGAVGAVEFTATANPHIIISNVSHSPSVVMSRHVQSQRQIVADWHLQSTHPVTSLRVDLIDALGNETLDCNVTNPSNGPGTCTITLTNGFPAGLYHLRYRADGVADALGETITVDDTDPLTLDTVGLSPIVLSLSQRNTTVYMRATSSQGVRHMEAGFVDDNGNVITYPGSACNTFAGQVATVATGSCTLTAPALGTWEVRFHARDQAGNEASTSAHVTVSE